MKEERVNLLYSKSAYHTQKPHMSRIQTSEYKYPCIQNINVKNELSCIWHSNTNIKGHFGIPKVMFGRKVCGIYLDKLGKYGCCEDVSFIIDDVGKLPLIQQAMLHQEFIEIMKNCNFGTANDKYNYRVIKLFRKDFYKNFL